MIIITARIGRIGAFQSATTCNNKPIIALPSFWAKHDPKKTNKRTGSLMLLDHNLGKEAEERDLARRCGCPRRPLLQSVRGLGSLAWPITVRCCTSYLNFLRVTDLEVRRGPTPTRKRSCRVHTGRSKTSRTVEPESNGKKVKFDSCRYR